MIQDDQEMIQDDQEMIQDDQERIQDDQEMIQDDQEMIQDDPEMKCSPEKFVTNQGIPSSLLKFNKNSNQAVEL